MPTNQVTAEEQLQLLNPKSVSPPPLSIKAFPLHWVQEKRLPTESEGYTNASINESEPIRKGMRDPIMKDSGENRLRLLVVVLDPVFGVRIAEVGNRGRGGGRLAGGSP